MLHGFLFPSHLPKRPTKSKKHHPRSYQCDQQQRSPQKRVPEGFSLQFSSSRYSPLTLANFLVLHHKSRVCLSNTVYQETGPKAGCKIHLGKMTNFWTNLLSLPIPWRTGSICKASPTNESICCRHRPFPHNYITCLIYWNS